MMATYYHELYKIFNEPIKVHLLWNIWEAKLEHSNPC